MQASIETFSSNAQFISAIHVPPPMKTFTLRQHNGIDIYAKYFKRIFGEQFHFAN